MENVDTERRDLVFRTDLSSGTRIQHCQGAQVDQETPGLGLQGRIAQANPHIAVPDRQREVRAALPNEISAFRPNQVVNRC